MVTFKIGICTYHASDDIEFIYIEPTPNFTAKRVACSVGGIWAESAFGANWNGTRHDFASEAQAVLWVRGADAPTIGGAK